MVRAGAPFSCERLPSLLWATTELIQRSTSRSLSWLFATFRPTGPPARSAARSAARPCRRRSDREKAMGAHHGLLRGVEKTPIRSDAPLFEENKI